MSKGAKVVKGIVLKNHPKLQVPKGQTTGNVQTSRKNIQSLEVHLHTLCVDLICWVNVLCLKSCFSDMNMISQIS